MPVNGGVSPSHGALVCAGHPIAYKLMPANTQLLLAHPSSTTAQRASFATKR